VRMKNFILSFVLMTTASCGSIGFVSFNPADWFSKEPAAVSE